MNEEEQHNEEEQQNERQPDGEQAAPSSQKKRPLIRNFKEFLLLCGIAVFITGCILALFFDGTLRDGGMALLGLTAIFLIMLPSGKKKKGFKKVLYAVGVGFGVAAVELSVTGLVMHNDGIRYLGIAVTAVSLVFLLLSGEHLQLF
jgi:hypothetical protein